MTKEELEKEAEENSFRYTLDKPWVCEVERKQIMAHFEKGYLESAEPREKKIKSLGKRCLQLQEDKGRLTDELTKAKGIIRDFISVAIDYIDKEDKNYSYIVEAQQFLNIEVEK